MPATNPTELKLRSGRLQRSCEIKLVEGRDAKVRAVAEGVTPAAEADRPYRISVSSEVPVLTYDWYGNPYYEVLGHNDGEADLTRFYAGAAIRDTHWGEQVGSISDPELKDGRCWVNAGFMSSPKGQVYDAGVREGHIQNVSLGYDVIGDPVLIGFKDEIPILRFKWAGYHNAMVPDPADIKVGFGRDGEASTEGRTVKVHTQGPEPGEEQGMRNRFGPRMDQAGAGGGGSTATEPAAPKVDVVAERTAAIASERERAADIENFAEAAGIGRDVYGPWIGEGMSVRDAAVKIRAHAATKGKPVSKPVDGLGFQERDAKRYYMTRALRITATQRGLGGFNEKADGIEFEAHRECERRFGRAPHGGMWLPMVLGDIVEGAGNGRSVDDIRLRTMGATVAGGGAETVYETHRELLEYLVPKVALIMAGVPVSTLDGPVSWAKETNDVDGYWTSENPPAGIADTEMNFGTIQMSPRTLMATMKWPRQLAMQSSINMESRAKAKMTGKIARLLDKGGLHGTGSGGQVTGIFNTPGVLTKALGGVADWTKLVNMVGQVADVEGDQLGDQGWLTTVLYAAALAAAQKVSGQDVFLWGTDPGTIRQSTLVGYPARSTNQVSKTLGAGSDEHGIVHGAFSQAEFGIGPAVEAILDEVTLATYAQLRLTCFQSADFAVKYPQAFIIGTGAKP